MRTGSHRVAATLLAAGFLGGWLSASWVSPPAVTTQAVPARPRPAAPAVAIPRVALERVAVPDARPDTRRNPFAFAERAPRPVSTETTAAPGTPAAAPAVDDATAAPVPESPWRLVGMAQGDDGGALTAIVSGLGDVHLVAPGDILPDGAEVAGLGPGSLELRLPDGVIRTLTLR